MKKSWKLSSIGTESIDCVTFRFYYFNNIVAGRINLHITKCRMPQKVLLFVLTVGVNLL